MLSTALLLARALRVTGRHGTASLTASRTTTATGVQRWTIEIYANGSKIAYAASRHLHRAASSVLRKIDT